MWYASLVVLQLFPNIGVFICAKATIFLNNSFSTFRLSYYYNSSWFWIGLRHLPPPPNLSICPVSLEAAARWEIVTALGKYFINKKRVPPDRIRLPCFIVAKRIGRDIQLAELSLTWVWLVNSIIGVCVQSIHIELSSVKISVYRLPMSRTSVCFFSSETHEKVFI